MRRIVIAGAGIVGASIAWQLGRRADVHVTILEKDKPAAGTTRDSFAWINATFSKQPRHYFELNREGVAAWKRLERAMSAPPVIQWGGSVAWTDKVPATLLEDVGQHASWGYPTHLVDEPTLRNLLPGVEPGPVTAAAYSEDEGVVDPVAATGALLADARADVQYPNEVIGLVMDHGRVQAVLTQQGTLACDVLILACGLATPGLAAMAGVTVPLKDSPGVLVHTPPQARVLNRVALGPGSHMKQDASGRIVAGDNFAGSQQSPEASIERGERLLMRAKAYLSKIDMTVERVSLGRRVMPLDEYPIVGFASECSNLYVVATHSGVTLAALLGEYAAAEIVDGVKIDMLEPYRLSRFGTGLA